MNDTFAKLNELNTIALSYGKQLVLALAILVFGLIAAGYLKKYSYILLSKIIPRPSLVATITNVLYVLFILFLAVAVLKEAGVDPLVIRRMLLMVTLAVVALIVLFRPYIPSLPFKVGNIIKTSDFMGKVEATTFLNTRIKTFDGKTVFIPNSKILNDYVINYHFTPHRRVAIEVGVKYDQDIMKAKQILETLFIEDPRILPTPRPAVNVKGWEQGAVVLWARGWADNAKAFMTKCELKEKTTLRFQNEGIIMAFTRRDMHLFHQTPLPDFEKEEGLT